jgi:hypothetical protein
MKNLPAIQDAAMLWLLGDKVGHTVVGDPRYED